MKLLFKIYLKITKYKNNKFKENNSIRGDQLFQENLEKRLDTLLAIPNIFVNIFEVFTRHIIAEHLEYSRC